MTISTRPAKLYVILGSHPCRSAMMMLEYKRIPYRTVRLYTGMQRVLPAFGFAGDTVPALEIDGRRVQTTIDIARALDEIESQPPLFPEDSELRRQVEEAEHWADEVLQMAVRRTVLAGALHGPDSIVNRGDDGRLGPLLWRRAPMRLIGTRIIGKFIFNVNRQTESRLLAALPAYLDKIDAWIADGVLNGPQLNAADFAIGPNVAMLLYRISVQPQIESRPVMELVDRLFPAYAEARDVAAPLARR